MEKISNGSKSAKAKGDLFPKLKKELVPHMKGEEKHFYSALADKRRRG
jgi:hypothetical protein